MLIYKVFFIILKIGFYLNVVGYKAVTKTDPLEVNVEFYLNVVGYKVEYIEGLTTATLGFI